MGFSGAERAVRVGLMVTALSVGACSPQINETVNSPSPTKIASELTPGATLPLNEHLDYETLERVSSNIVTINRGVKKGYEKHFSLEGACAGFVVRNRDVSFAATANHCLPGSITSNVDGKKYATKGADGSSIFTAEIVDPNKRNHVGDSNFIYYPNSEDDWSKDLALIQIKKGVGGNGLPLNVSDLKSDATYFSLKMENGEVRYHPIHFRNKDRNGGNLFLDLSNDMSSCIPGSSGSAVVNTAGEVVSLLMGGASYELNAQDIARFNLNHIHIGRIVSMCYTVPSSRIVELLKN